MEYFEKLSSIKTSRNYYGNQKNWSVTSNVPKQVRLTSFSFRLLFINNDGTITAPEYSGATNILKQARKCLAFSKIGFLTVDAMYLKRNTGKT